MGVAHEIAKEPGGRSPEELAARVREIGAGGTAPEEVLELALRAVLDAAEVGAGALCLFDARRQVLRLATEVGLSDEGCRRLRAIGAGTEGAEAWTLPLESLRVRRACLLDAENGKGLPRLVEPAAAARSLACVPVFAGEEPQACLVLVAFAPRVLVEGDVRGLEPALAELGRLIGSTRARAGAVEAPTDEEMARVTAEMQREGLVPGSVETLLEALAVSERRRTLLVAALEVTVRAEHGRARAALADAEALVAGVRGAQEEAARLREAAQAAVEGRERMEAELRAARAEATEAREHAERSGGEMAALREERDRLAASSDAREAEAARLAEALASVTAERARLAEALAAAEQTVRTAGERAAPEAAAPAPAPPGRPEPPAEAPEPPPAASESPAAPEPPAAPAGHVDGVMVIDLDPTWADGANVEGGVTVLAPAEASAAAAAGRVAHGAIVNLAVAGAAAALTALAETMPPGRLVACIAPPGTGRSAALGRVVAAPRTSDPAVLAAMVGRIAGRGARIVTASDDVDALAPIRRKLAEGGVSVSMAWDSKQALDLLEMMRPVLVVVDLALPRAEGYGLVARLAAAEPVPSLLLLVGDEDPAAGLAAALDERCRAPVATRAHLLSVAAGGPGAAKS
jgi:CheY-like chemotaxis protein